MSTIDQLQALLHGDPPAKPHRRTRTDAYRFVEQMLRRIDYFHLGRSDKGVVRRFLGHETGLSRAQVTRLLNQHRTTGRVVDHRRATARSFPRHYTNADIERLAEIDALHGSWCGAITRELCARAWHLFEDQRFERLAGISNGHLYNLRHSTTYRRHRATRPEPTHPISLMPNDRWRPRPYGRPGHIRVVPLRPHGPGDTDGPHHLNLSLVDEVTMFQLVVSVEHLDPECLTAVLHALRKALPFLVRSFHATAGAAHDARRAAGVLHELNLADPCALRRDCILSRRTQQVNAFARKVLSPYLNYHRPRRFPGRRAGPTARLRTDRRKTCVLTPYERLKSLPDAASCLKPGTTFADLDAIATAVSDNDAARALSEATVRLLRIRRPLVASGRPACLAGRGDVAGAQRQARVSGSLAAGIRPANR